MSAADLQVLENTLGYSFRNQALLIRALTHKSRSSEQRALGDSPTDNEQLEFLGDAVLGFVSSEWLVRQCPDFTEGRLSVLRACLVSADHLAEAAREISLGDYLQLGRGEEKGGGRGKDSLLADALEALIAAVYLDAGLEAARTFVIAHVIGQFDPEITAANGQSNFKGPLQERVQELGLPPPRYTTIAVNGPQHARVFTVEVRVGEEMASRGEGSSKKSAGQMAARAMLRKLDATGMTVLSDAE